MHFAWPEACTHASWAHACSKQPILCPCRSSPGITHLAAPVRLQCICKACARVLLGPEERARFLRAFRSARLERAHRAGIFKRILEACKKRRSCPHCGALNCTVKCAAPRAAHLVSAHFWLSVCWGPPRYKDGICLAQ